jgi:hypothetical protein
MAFRRKGANRGLEGSAEGPCRSLSAALRVPEAAHLGGSALRLSACTAVPYPLAR